MELTATVADIKAFKPKKGAVEVEEDKVYEFELCTRYEASRARDKKTDTPLGSGWPPSFSYPNHGIGYNTKTKKTGNWRYIEGQPSIWVSDQADLEQYEKNDIYELLGQDQNQLEFRDGRMLVRGDDSGKLRLEALMVQDYFEGNEKPYQKSKPKQFFFKLNNPDTVIEKANNNRDMVFETMQQARECTISEMLAVSFIMGINIDDTSDRGLNKIKNEFLSRAEYDPRNPKGLEFFQSVINNPATKIKYIFAKGLERGIISASQQPGKLTWAKPNAAIMDLMGKIPPVDELTMLVIDKKQIAMDTMEELEKQLNN